MVPYVSLTAPCWSFFLNICEKNNLFSINKMQYFILFGKGHTLGKNNFYDLSPVWFLPEQVSSSCAQRRAESQQRHPITYYEPETAGYQYRDPDGHRNTKI